MFGTPLTPDAIEAETAYRLERTKRAFRSARRERPEQAGPAPAAKGSPGPPAHRRGVDDDELTRADLCATGKHAIQHVREHLTADGILSAAELRTAPANTRVRAAGVVTRRQRAATASGITFIDLEDETGMIKVIVSPGRWARHRKTARDSSALIITGRLERANGVTKLNAERLERLHLDARAIQRRDSPLRD